LLGRGLATLRRIFVNRGATVEIARLIFAAIFTSHLILNTLN
jgi:hypothetical protein